MTKSEKKILAKIRRWLRYQFHNRYTRYDFWFIYNTGCDIDTAISWEGGFDIADGTRVQFRNQYSIAPGKQVVKNW